MRASIGGIVNLFLIMIFIVIISSLLLFNVSYAKAYRVKNKIITTYEQYEGNCGNNTACHRQIKQYEDGIGYNVTKELVADQAQNEVCYQDLGYCAIRQVAANYKGNKKAYTFRIRTEVKVRFPFVEDILGVGKFAISGKTKEIITG